MCAEKERYGHMSKSPLASRDDQPVHPQCIENASAWLFRYEVERALARSCLSLSTNQGPDGLRVVACPEHATFSVGQRDGESHGAGVFIENLSPSFQIEKFRPHGFE